MIFFKAIASAGSLPALRTYKCEEIPTNLLVRADEVIE
jgi:hypothetical protein